MFQLSVPEIVDSVRHGHRSEQLERARYACLLLRQPRDARGSASSCVRLELSPEHSRDGPFWGSRRGRHASEGHGKPRKDCAGRLKKPPAMVAAPTGHKKVAPKSTKPITYARLIRQIRRARGENVPVTTMPESVPTGCTDKTCANISSVDDPGEQPTPKVSSHLRDEVATDFALDPSEVHGALV